MNSLAQTIKKCQPTAIISLSPNPYTFSLESYLLDWQKWQQKNLIDELIIQVYRTDMNAFDWDQSKRYSNIEKHGIDFAAVPPIFDDPEVADRFEDDFDDDFDYNHIINADLNHSVFTTPSGILIISLILLGAGSHE